ncbi:alpha-ketoglutarate-dependent dioxygenase AlkB family protein [Phyllobacterium myrsinacearum]|uniref:Alkylated DNA repair dioxygenase n=1 Tax=Phyllobacterium myrsinacearum TaxID=28101 RepID=A0A2S9JJ32_9HYPH|nr:alpha-ketoglutarate-dependent dioxygenase AlkB [Phyllobacterium myrsinacearum]PRD53116.1 alkylated DNA repair dioxygenase [Phyllobacterium myrsinacearum]PWV94037.1 DNA-N1-methyladenine dioxygenase [Phyllobacterium myrsinacearum]RZV07524.1 DNA-N1-methyladenine dioxygenase [Phyllobacterium myrsinacearum]
MLQLAPGIRYFPDYLSLAEQVALVDEIRSIVAEAPLYIPAMPKTGKEMSVRMTNCGALGWVTDKERGYRYQAVHPVTQKPWPAIPSRLLTLWENVGNYPLAPEACLVNFYAETAKMGLHQDRDEQNFSAPVVSISLGDSCLFRFGGVQRSDKTQSIRLKSGDVIVLGDEGRLAFHGVDRIYPGTSTLLKAPGRINLTLRRVTAS